jgi:hypothetical protein
MILPHHDDYRPPRDHRPGIWIERIILIIGTVFFAGILYLFGSNILR